MTRRPSRRIALTILMLIIPGCTRHVAESQPAPRSSDEGEIRAAMSASADSWNRGDLRGHLAIYVDSVTFMTKSGPRPGVAAIEEAFNRSYFRDGQPKQRLGFDQLAIRFLGRDFALLTGHFQLTGGGEPDQAGWFTIVWTKTAQGWKALHDHSS
jgi:uncharacterized protein (TIGR02246 family)